MAFNIMKHIFVLFFCIWIFKSCSGAEQRLPNIVFIMADDLGTEVLGCYGGSSYNTPNIDRLAATGVKFSHCYSSPVCSPTRVNLLTGRYGFRTGQSWGVLPEDEITFGTVLQKAGYKTALAGKWQMKLLRDNPDHITQNGFEQNCVFGWHEGPRYYEPLIYQNGQIRQDVKEKYGPDVYAQFLIDFIRENKDTPFLAYYPMTLAHEISNDLDSPPPPGPQGRYQSYKELVEYADSLVGRVIQVLDELQLLEKTVILFSADNGTPWHFITRYENGEYIREPVYSAMGDSMVRGGKTMMNNAGTHVPLIAKWQGVTIPGTVNNALIDFSDFMPTFAELAQTDLPADRVLDGHSFVDQLTGDEDSGRPWIYVQWQDSSWIRNQQWKLYSNSALFNMTKDPAEKNPIRVDQDTDDANKSRMYLQGELLKLRRSKK